MSEDSSIRTIDADPCTYNLYYPPYPWGANDEGVWRQHDFENAPSLGPPTVGVAVATCFLTALFTTVRVYTNFRKLHAADCEYLLPLSFIKFDTC